MATVLTGNAVPCPEGISEQFWRWSHLPMPIERLKQVFPVPGAWYMVYFWRQFCEKLLQLEQSGAIALAGCRQRFFSVLFGNRLQGFGKFSPRMSPAAHNLDILRQRVVSLVTICMKPPGKPFQELLRMSCLAAWLVFI